MKKLSSIDDFALSGAPPLFDEVRHVGRPNVGDETAFLARTKEIFDSRWFSNHGVMVQRLEQRLAEHLGVKHCICTCNGTLGLEIAARALGLEGEVIVPSYTFVATAHALQWQGITPVFADIDARTHTLDPASVRDAITRRTTGILGVHLWGRPCAIDELQAVADEHGLQLLFDAAHAFSCAYKGRMIGNFGRCEVFSFHATKFFNTFEGGAIATNDDELAERVQLIKNFGFAGFDSVVLPGTNGKMVEVCAAMGLTGLESLEKFLDVNRRNYQAYCEGMAGIAGLSPMKYDDSERCNYQYIVIEVNEGFPLARDEIISLLHSENVLARKYFWPGCHNMEPYLSADPTAGRRLPQTQVVADRVFVLPTGTSMNVAEIEGIVELLREASRPRLASAIKQALAVRESGRIPLSMPA